MRRQGVPGYRPAGGRFVTGASNSSNSSLVSQPRVLVVDDEDHVRSALVDSLHIQGYRADEACSGYQALEMLGRTTYAVMVVDLRMPGMDGVEVMRRAAKMCPDLSVVVLTGHPTLDTAISALKLRAVDYLLKPASLQDVVAAVASALERRGREMRQRRLMQVMGRALEEMREIEDSEDVGNTPMQDRFLRVGPVMLDREKCQVVVAEEDDADALPVELTLSETKLLAYLMQRPGIVLPCSELAQAALGYDVEEQSAPGIIRPHICRLRKKIEPDPDHPRLICTVPGKGYLFTP